MLEYLVYKEVIKDLDGKPHVFFEDLGRTDTYEEACEWVEDELKNEPDTVFHIDYDEDWV